MAGEKARRAARKAESGKIRAEPYARAGYMSEISSEEGSDEKDEE